MKGFIKLTSVAQKQTLYINPETIGHIYDVPEQLSYGHVEVKAHTIVGTTTHNNGGFKVIESSKRIIAMIKKFNEQ
jgi:hypothetical protein